MVVEVTVQVICIRIGKLMRCRHTVSMVSLEFTYIFGGYYPV